MVDSDPLFISKVDILSFHAEQIRLFGGANGLRDDGLLDSAVAAPQNVYCYEESSDVFDLAASYVSAIVRNHPFIDGNKRTAAMAAVAFLRINGLSADMDQVLFAAVVESLITRSCDEVFVARYFFIGCLIQVVQESMEGPDEAAFEAFKAASPGERRAIVVDYVTSKSRAGLIEKCRAQLIRPDRFSEGIDFVEEKMFEMVEEKWRAQFGMA